ncbi:MAG: HNH endonuclease [Bacteroidetes bacterium]|nr:HNH endonuclease [Rhodothermia bacterium]MCS7155281.1 HNH endonuclease [Bacteroidota bacterium]MCX7907866.1 HNH endonuclease [Bacteroidota bacterium]MDW8138685.1 HNH endonuclease [Bacteroidota bacterium]MDW8284729.1 HNH endonuclease [Bacteroidota bacterium]
MRVLVLNHDYRPLTICSVQRAIGLLCCRKAELLAARDGYFLHSPSTRLPLPSIIRLRYYVAIPHKRVMLSRRNVLRRDGFRCQYCGSRERLTVDHVVPKSKGGTDSWENLVTACTACNNRKGNRTPEEAGMRLLRRPFRPSHILFLRASAGNFEESWKPYLFM